MKKIVTLFTALTLISAAIFAQPIGDNPDDPFERDKFEQEKLTTKVIVPENQHCTDKNASIKIEYQPIYDEVRIYYETLYVTYDKGEAMNSVMAVLQDFQKEYKYYSYRYLKDDKEKYFKDERGQRRAQYSSYLKFSR
ncbi:MAG: hypothetical protein J6X84_00495 [Treponema sp.]|nr:hypothetical protein [Treponema sp.]